MVVGIGGPPGGCERLQERRVAAGVLADAVEHVHRPARFAVGEYPVVVDPCAEAVDEAAHPPIMADFREPFLYPN
jgi:hypothetical protein